MRSMRIPAPHLLVVLLLLDAHGGRTRPAAAQAETSRRPELTVASVVDVDRAFSALPVGFDLLTHGNRQFVAYYGADRWLYVAARQVGETEWERVRLQERFPWDSHNGITMAVDAAGHLHLAANMHVDSLNYYRTALPQDITTFEKIDRMTGRDEARCTYPSFLTGADGRLVFSYRDGASGNGRQIFNVYDPSDRQWRRLLDQPLLDGVPRDMNAYPLAPRRGPDGAFHLAWMWRDSPDAATNHDLSYMRSPDLVHWESAAGEALTLPITPDHKAVVVDSAPVGTGLINMGFALGFDGENRPIVSYHRYDANGNSQIYNARWESDRWRIYRTSDWSMRWDFGGNGSIPSRVGAGAVRALQDGRLVQDYHHWRHGDGTWELDPVSLAPVRQVVVDAVRPSELERVRSEFPGMHVRWKSDSGSSGQPRAPYMLRWETLEQNRDRTREGPLPEPSPLQVYQFVEP